MITGIENMTQHSLRIFGNLCFCLVYHRTLVLSLLGIIIGTSRLIQKRGFLNADLLLPCIPRNMPICKDLHPRVKVQQAACFNNIYYGCLTFVRSSAGGARLVRNIGTISIIIFQLSRKREQCKHSEQEISNIVYTSAVEQLIDEQTAFITKTNRLNWKVFSPKYLAVIQYIPQERVFDTSKQNSGVWVDDLVYSSLQLKPLS
ncbi:Hypothetical_protein [Hexamita inflata]|uniref:Hypothetical_protein n=1 Tax=Hexamita inflata TaxID=28002 RepID=A0AA86P7X7_9EUKA|nr:Hypothetical protein HINF_LOCUS20256 [Hexamita inflata]CAI9932613.1 Hypothetical protein HINF_LOCUS20258 [Hexamita inflata]